MTLLSHRHGGGSAGARPAHAAFRRAVGALTLAAATWTAAPAFADEPAAGGTPLTPKPSTPLAPAPAPQTGTVGWKLFLGAGVIAAFAFWYQKKHPRAAQRGEPPQIRVVARTRVGLRADLLIVEVQGQTLLLGVGAQGIQNLALLDSPADRSLADPGPEKVDARVPARLDALLRAANRPPIEDALDEEEPPAEPPGEQGAGGGQAAGLRKWIVR
jgi:flagellar biogenesis protein FliO